MNPVFRSLGCTIVEMLIGKPPYATMAPPMFMGAMYNLAQGVHSELNFDPKELVPASSNEMQKFLAQLLTVDHHKRLRSGNETMDIFKSTF
jgi:serine/threonine protein kinase